MTEERSQEFNYLTFEIIEEAYNIFFERYLKLEEPIPDFKFADKDKLKELIHISQHTFNGVDLYPTIEEKASIIFYKINKGHIFLNGNKRMSVFFMLLFLLINNKQIGLPRDEITKKALEIAISNPDDFDIMKVNLSAWISENLIESTD